MRYGGRLYTVQEGRLRSRFDRIRDGGPGGVRVCSARTPHQNLSRSCPGGPCSPRLISVPHRRQGRPARPYTQLSHPGLASPVVTCLSGFCSRPATGAQAPPRQQGHESTQQVALDRRPAGTAFRHIDSPRPPPPTASGYSGVLSLINRPCLTESGPLLGVSQYCWPGADSLTAGGP